MNVEAIEYINNQLAHAIADPLVDELVVRRGALPKLPAVDALRPLQGSMEEADADDRFLRT